GAAKHGEDRAVLEEVDGVVTPFAGGNLAAVKAENAVELAPVESDSACGGEGQRAPGLAPMELARLGIAVAHPAPPSMWRVGDGNDRARNTHRQERMDDAAALRRDCDIVTGDHHGFVNGIMMLPNSGQARAKLECESRDRCLRARSCLAAPDSSAPQPPGV